MITETIILAGGKGERLFPLTETTPKPLLPINNIPVLSHVLRSLEKCGIRRATLSLGYQADRIRQRYGNLFRTLSLSYAVEDTPLGTAGAVRQAAHCIEPLMGKGDILVLSGDAVFEGDLSRLIASHERSGADLTIAAKTLDNVSGYGVITGKPSRIEAFVEKPDPHTAPSHTVNLGIYLFSGRLLAEIPNGPYDFGKDLFPALLRKGYSLAYYLYDDYWCDIGRFSDYLAANLRLSDGKNCIGNGCTLANDCQISESVLLDGVTVGKNCRIRSSVIAEGAVIEDGVTLEGAVIGANCRITHSLPFAATVQHTKSGNAVSPITLPIL